MRKLAMFGTLLVSLVLFGACKPQTTESTPSEQPPASGAPETPAEPAKPGPGTTEPTPPAGGPIQPSTPAQPGGGEQPK